MALPTFVAAGAMSNSAVGNITPALPAGLAADDIMLLFCETPAGVTPAAPAGWAHVFGSPQATDTTTTLSVMWKRAGGSESAPTVVFGSNHISGHIEAFRGCVATGDPWALAYGKTKEIASTTMTAQGSGTPVDDCLVVVASAMGEDTTGGRASSPANADLANVAERFDNFTTDGDGGGVVVVTGEKASAGSFGATTWTWVNSVADVHLVLVLMPVGATNPMPQLVGVGAPASSATVDITPALPAGTAENDILVLVCESVTGAPATPSGGWAALADSPQTSATGNGTTLSVFWKRAGPAEAAPTVVRGALNHIIGTIAAFRGCILTGDPWNVTSGGHNDTADTAFSALGDTTTVINCLVVVMGGNGTDSAAAQFKQWSNPDVGLVEILDNFTSVGNGGGTAVAIGWKLAIGTYGTSTAVLANSAADAWMTGALKPVPGAGGTAGSSARSFASVIG